MTSGNINYSNILTDQSDLLEIISTNAEISKDILDHNFHKVDKTKIDFFSGYRFEYFSKNFDSKLFKEIIDKNILLNIESNNLKHIYIRFSIENKMHTVHDYLRK